jgi:hypothetical protein
MATALSRLVTRRRAGFAVPLVAGSLLAVAAPAMAVTATCSGTPATCVAGVPVSVVGLGGTRQFTVQDVHGNDLTSLDLGTGGVQPFRTHVQDTGFTATGQSFSVSATMSNLYLRTASGHDYAVKVPSSALAIGFGSTPLTGSGISLDTLPKLTVGGTMPSCLNLSASLQSALGLSVLGIPLDPSNLALTTLCTLLGLTGGPVSATVDGAVQNVAPTLSSLTNLPIPLSGAVGGAFSNPDFGTGTVGANDPGKNATPATSVPLMAGGPANLTAGLTSALTTTLTNTLNGLPLVTSNDVGAKTSVAAAVTALSGSADLLTSTLGTVLAGLTSVTNQVAVLNSLAGTLIAPTLANIQSLNGVYDGFPVLHATPTTPVAGTYDGTLTVTFVQA